MPRPVKARHKELARGWGGMYLRGWDDNTLYLEDNQKCYEIPRSLTGHEIVKAAATPMTNLPNDLEGKPTGWPGPGHKKGPFKGTDPSRDLEVVEV